MPVTSHDNGIDMTSVSEVDAIGSPTTMDIARGRIEGARQAQIEGTIHGIVNRTRDVSELGVDVVPTPDITGEVMYVSSSSNNDTILGSGTRAVTVEYIEPVTEILTQVEVELNGTTQVQVPVPIAFVSDFYASKSATLDTVNAGDIIIENFAGTVFNIITAGGNKSLTLFRYIPKGKNLYLTGLDVSGNSKEVSVRLRATISDNLTRTEGYIFRTVSVSADGANNIIFDPPMVIVEQAYLKASVFSDSQDNAGVISVGINGWLEDNYP